MRQSRLLTLLFLLRRRGRATAPELARELGVSVRTLYRDVEALEAAGVPLYTERGPHGGVRLVEGWRARLDGLTAQEADVLTLSAVPAAVSGLGLASVAMTARAKLDASLPPELRARMSRVRERFLLDAPGWFARPEPLDALPALSRAVWEGRRVELVYRGARRRVEPLGLVLKGGTWYLAARHRREVRAFRVGRIERVTPRPERVAEAPFDLAAWWTESSARFETSLLRWPLTVRLSPRAQRRLAEVVPQDAVRARIAEAPVEGDGWKRVSLRLESEEVAADQLHMAGEGVEVLSPTSLRARLHALALAQAELNAPLRARSTAPCARGPSTRPSPASPAGSPRTAPRRRRASPHR